MAVVELQLAKEVLSRCCERGRVFLEQSTLGDRIGMIDDAAKRGLLFDDLDITLRADYLRQTLIKRGQITEPSTLFNCL